MSTALPSEAEIETSAVRTLPLPSPRALQAELPLPESLARLVSSTRAAIREVLHGSDAERLIVLAGPCSIHDRGAALEYGRRLAKLAHEHRDTLVVVMRSYFEKPRTTLGWKGLITDPHLDESCDLAQGISLARELLLELGSLGIPCGGEMLGTLAPAYLADALSWAGIGARTVESQPHRELASGLPMPVGVKNGTDGKVRTARDAVVAIREPHVYLGLDSEGGPAVVRTRGNPDAHIVLRGGSRGGNADAAAIARTAQQIGATELARPLLVDCSHGNSGKDHRRQAGVFRQVLRQVETGQSAIAGLSLESHLRPGRQDLRPGTAPAAGVSITDACIGWNETEDLLGEAAASVRRCR